MIAHNRRYGSGTNSALNTVNKETEDTPMKDTIKNFPEYKTQVVAPKFNCAELPTYKEEGEGEDKKP